MNTISHALIGYTASIAIFGPEIARDYTAPILISSTIMDIDHIPYLIKHFKTSIKSVKKGHATPYLQGVLHRAHSQMFFLLAVLVLYFFMPTPLINIIAMNIFLHMAVDALVDVKYHAFFPFTHKLLSIRIFGHKWKRTIADLATIPLLAFVLWII